MSNDKNYGYKLNIGDHEITSNDKQIEDGKIIAEGCVTVVLDGVSVMIYRSALQQDVIMVEVDHNRDESEKDAQIYLNDWALATSGSSKRK